MVGQPTLETLLRGQSRAALAEFVAALYRARGAETTREGAVVVVDGERVLVVGSSGDALGHRLRFIGAVRPGERDVEPVDRVVAVDHRVAARVAERYGAHAMSAGDLDRLARYGLDRVRADALYRASFGRPVAAVEPGGTSPRRVRATAPDQRRRSPLFVGLVGLVGVVLVVGAMSGVGTTAGSFSWAWDAPETVSVSTPATTPPGSEPATPTTETALTKAPSLIPSTSARFAPGVTQNGVADADALAEAHAAALGTDGYQWELTYVETVNGVTTARGRETVLVASPREFVSSVEWVGTPTGVTPVAFHPSYADGDVRHRPGSNGTVVSYQLLEGPPAGEQGWRASRHIRWYLSGADSTLERTLIHADEPTAVVVIDGTNQSTVAQYTGRAHVTSDGFVRFLTVSYLLSADGGSGAETENEVERHDRARGSTESRVSAQVTFRYVETNASVSPPAWYRAGASYQHSRWTA